MEIKKILYLTFIVLTYIKLKASSSTFDNQELEILSYLQKNPTLKNNFIREIQKKQEIDNVISFFSEEKSCPCQKQVIFQKEKILNENCLEKILKKHLAKEISITDEHIPCMPIYYIFEHEKNLNQISGAATVQNYILEKVRNSLEFYHQGRFQIKFFEQYCSPSIITEEARTQITSYLDKISGANFLESLYFIIKKLGIHNIDQYYSVLNTTNQINFQIAFMQSHKSRRKKIKLLLFSQIENTHFMPEDQCEAYKPIFDCMNTEANILNKLKKCSRKILLFFDQSIIYIKEIIPLSLKSGKQYTKKKMYKMIRYYQLSKIFFFVRTIQKRIHKNLQNFNGDPEEFSEFEANQKKMLTGSEDIIIDKIIEKYFLGKTIALKKLNNFLKKEDPDTFFYKFALLLKYKIQEKKKEYLLPRFSFFKLIKHDSFKKISKHANFNKALLSLCTLINGKKKDSFTAISKHANEIKNIIYNKEVSKILIGNLDF